MDTPKTNGLVERMNGLTKEATTKARRYQTTKARRYQTAQKMQKDLHERLAWLVCVLQLLPQA